MSAESPQLHLPKYADFVDAIEPIALELSPSELHGIMCGYLCAGADTQGEAYLRALIHDKKDKAARSALLALFAIYTVSQQQIAHFDFQFELMLPDDEAPLSERALAFSQWCEGFMMGLALSGISEEHFSEEEAQDAFQHLTEFSELDSDSLEVDEEDEKALMEVSEYARMAVIRLHGDLVMNKRKQGESGAKH